MAESVFTLTVRPAVALHLFRGVTEMFLISIGGRVTIASGMLWYQDVRKMLKIDAGLLLEVLIVGSGIGLPLMFLVRITSGATMPELLSGVFSAMLAVYLGVVFGVLLFEPLVSQFKSASVRRWILTTLLYTALVALVNGGQI
jgi:hypothetical protein